MNVAGHTDESILSALFNGPLEPSNLALELKKPVAEIESRIYALRALGYSIELAPHRGYLLSAAPDNIIADEIRARLPNNRFARRLVVFRETRSTNDIALKAGDEGESEGFTALAECQTHGRGRNGRSWAAADKKGLWLSLLFRPDWPLERAFCLTYLASVALCRTVARQTGLQCGIKWPNDVLINNRKLAGVLTEARSTGTKLDYAVVGLGCNFAQENGDFPRELDGLATSLAMEGPFPDLRRADLLVGLLAEIERLYAISWEDLRETWKTLCLSIGRTIRVRTGGRLLEGLMIGLEQEGNLLLRLPSGKIEVINSGEIVS